MVAGTRVAVVLLALFIVGVFSAASPSPSPQCGLTIKQPNPSCAFSGTTTCKATSGTVPYPLPSGEDYNSFYSWILGVIGVDGVTVDTKWVNQATTDPNIYFKGVSASTQCYLNLTFVYEVASFRNRVGYFSFNKATSKVVKSNTLIFQESSVDCQSTGQSCLAPGSTVVSIGPFAGNESVGLYLQQNQICGGSNTFYSLDSLNTQDKSSWKTIPKTGRLVAVFRDPNTQRVYYGFEDFPNGDQDYNDNVYSLSSSCPIDYSKIPCSTTCRNANQTVDLESCTCYCPNKNTTTCPGAQTFNDTACYCGCPSSISTTCSGNLRFNNIACQCQCPASPPSGVTCKANEYWDTASCSCKCPGNATLAGVTCPNVYYQWDLTTCDCSCPKTAALAGVTCRNLTTWNTAACNCTCPSSGSCPGNKAWVQNNDPDICGCHCPSSPPASIGSCPGNYVWNSTEAECACFCPYEAPASDPCAGNFVWNRDECDCTCPDKPTTPCPGFLEWDKSSCSCICPEDDPCVDQATACKQFQCDGNTGKCVNAYVETCSSYALQYPATGCLEWYCDDDIGCVRTGNESCCTQYSNCTLCAAADGCSWLGASCNDSGQVLISPIDPISRTDCFPSSSGLTPGQTAGITVGVVTGVAVGVGGAAALLGAGYIVYRILNKPPAPEQLPTVENLDTEVGTDENPLFHKNEVEMTNPMFAAGGGGGGGDAGAMFAQGGGASAIPADMHTL